MNNPEGDAALQRGNSTPKKSVVGRPWKKGQSGNPSGKRRGCVSLTAALKRLLTEADAEAVIRKLVELAKGGDLRAVEIIFARLDEVQLERRLSQLEALVEQRNASRLLL